MLTVQLDDQSAVEKLDVAQIVIGQERAGVPYAAKKIA
jgi:hypothetical protein